MSTIVGVYGTLRKGFGLHDVLGESSYLGTHVLTIPYRMVNVGSYPALLPTDEQEDIVVELYEVDEDTLRRLDMVEGVPTLYNRRVVDFKDYKVNLYIFTDVEWGETLEPISSGDFKAFREAV